MKLTINSTQTMTSREIAELTGKEHRHVLRDVEVMLEQLEMPIEGYAQNWTHPQNGMTYIQYVLPKDLTLTLVSGYNVVLRKRIIDRWQELERSAPQTLSLPDFTNPAEAARAWAAQYEEKLALAAEIEAARPAIEFKERYVDSSSGAKGFREVCKLLKVKEPAFRAFLLEKKIMYRLGGEWTPYAEHLDAGRFEVKAGTSEVNGHAYNTARFTPKGIAWVAGLWTAHKLKQEHM